MSYTIVKPKDRDAWLVERKKGLGSSDAGTIMGVSPFSTPLRLWRLKMGIDPPVEETDAMRNGHYFEASTAEYFAATTGSYVDPTTANDWLAVSDQKPWLRVSPDRLFWLPNVEHKPENALILELKSTNKVVDPDNIPLYWYCQVQYQMGVMGIKMAAVAWVTALPKLGFGHTWVTFNEAFYKTLEAKLDEFWNTNILKRIEPEATDEEDTSLLWPEAQKDKYIAASDQDELIVEQYKELTEQINEKQKEQSQLAATLKAKIQDGEYFVKYAPDGTRHTLITYKHNRKNVFDAQRFQNEQPNLYKKYTTEVLDTDELKTFDRQTWDKYNNVTKGPRVFKVL